ncbi:MAG: type I-E CRISPR-associated protein Cas6/Cse3/CasE [Myxococcota bacterium]
MTLYLVRTLLEIPGLMNLGRNRRLPVQKTDLGYLTHCALLEVFGEQAPKPFAVPRSLGRWAEVLGYATTTPEQLREHAETFAPPHIYNLVRWEEWSHKPMPDQWQAGRTLGFDIRLCPVVRKSKGVAGRCKPGAEVDAFLSACWDAGDDAKIDREAIYRTWLAEQLERRGGATLTMSRLKAFQRQRLLRRTHAKQQAAKPRCAHVLERPDALMEGVLEIVDGERFSSMLRMGIGRHRSFGFGMFLLKPARRVPAS